MCLMKETQLNRRDFIRTAGLGVAALAGQAPLYAGLFVPKLDPHELQEVIPQAVAAGADGVALFSRGAMSPAHFEAARRALR